MLTSIPNLLTASRIVLIPLIVVMFWVDGTVARWVTLAFFIIAGVTDYLDGVAARSMGETSKLGKFMDPVADKLLVASILMMLVAFDRISDWVILPALVILCREILVSGLREFLAEIKVGLPVSRLAKWKTGVQMTALGFLIVSEVGPVWYFDFLTTVFIGEALLWIAALLTIITGYDYLRAGLKHMSVDDGGGAPPPA